jgi:hypothetical protein
LELCGLATRSLCAMGTLTHRNGTVTRLRPLISAHCCVSTRTGTNAWKVLCSAYVGIRYLLPGCLARHVACPPARSRCSARCAEDVFRHKPGCTARHAICRDEDSRELRLQWIEQQSAKAPDQAPHQVKATTLPRMPFRRGGAKGAPVCLDASNP